MDILSPEVLEPREPKRRNRRPSPLQIKALQLVQQGMSKRKAMLQAGYSLSSANNSQKLMRARGVKNALESMRTYLEQEGINQERLAKKLNQFLEQKKIDHSHTEPDMLVDDTDTQRFAWDRAHKIVNPDTPPEGLKRKLTIEEFITGPTDGPDEK